MALALIATLTVLNSERVLGTHAAGHVQPDTCAASPYTVQHTDTARVLVTARGADGGSNADATGGTGSLVSAILPAVFGNSLRCFVGAGGGGGGPQSSLPAGTVAGSNGGGASGVSTNAVPFVPLLVAGGGGGAGGAGIDATSAVVPPGNGGNAPQGAAAPNCAVGAAGDDGLLAPVTSGQGGQGGNCTGGGDGGDLGGQAGTGPGAPGTGGTGGGGQNLGAGGGGGGGGGYTGGGGGGAGAAAGGGGGGGGGASFVTAAARSVTVSPGGGPAFVEITELKAECSDGVDNTDPEDVLVDAADPGCHTDANAADGDATYDPNDNDETDGAPAACDDNIDNDNDGKTDFPADPGCTDANDNDERDTTEPKPQCSDGIDNDNDGKTDFPADPGCTDANDNNEVDPGTPGQEGPPGDGTCTDGIDNDGDGLIDGNDPGCQEGGEGPPGSNTCTDGIDNDGDGLIDANDPGCQGGTPTGPGGRPFTDISVDVNANNAKLPQRKTVGFTITVRNLGPDNARNIEIITKVDKGHLAFKNVFGTGCNAAFPNSSIVRCVIAALNSGQSTLISIEAKTKGHGKAKVEVVANLTEGSDFAPSDNVDRERIRITQRGKRGRRR